jgi:glycosyltransferase involved in cell wall biosynthesis
MNKIYNKSSIAILLGVYNGALYIEEQIDSILAQTFQDWTLYIRDDDSKDNTLEIINNYSLMHPKIVVIKDGDGNLGCNGNYFRLLSLVESRYYMFCNADDFWFPFKIQLTFDRYLLEESNHKDKPIIVHTDLSISDINLKVLTKSYWESINTDPEKFKTYNKLGLCSIAAGATMLFNQKVKDLTFPVSKHAPFFDHWMALKVVEKGIISSIHTPTISYRQIGTNLAAVSINKENTIFYKLASLKKVIQINRKEARMLRKIGWGSILKYAYYKVVVFSMLRFGKKYNPNSYTGIKP